MECRGLPLKFSYQYIPKLVAHRCAEDQIDQKCVPLTHYATTRF